MKLKGWIAMKGADYEGLWADDDSHPVYFDEQEAREAANKLKSRWANAPDIVEVEIDVEAVREAT